MERPQSADPAKDPAFQQAVEEIVYDNQKVFGFKYKPRNQEPSMFDLLQWKAPDNEQWDFKSVNKNITKAEEYQKYKVKIAKEKGLTENRDQFREFHYDKDAKTYLPDIDAETLQRMQYEKIMKQDQSAEKPKIIIQQDPYIIEPVVPIEVRLNKNAPNSEYTEQYKVKDVRNAEKLVGVLADNYSKTGKKILTYSPSQNLYYQQDVDQKQQQQGQQDETQQDGSAAQNQTEQERDQSRSYSKPDIKNAKSKLLSYKKKAKVLDPNNDDDQKKLERRKMRIKNLEETTRWLPNSAFVTYFGKPAFENYGMGNVKPTIGGCVYGNYLLTHNVNPHRGQNPPKFVQSYANALNYSERLPDCEPQPPRKCKEDIRLSQDQVEVLKKRSPLQPPLNQGKNIKIVKPDLVNSLRFASEENTPTKVDNLEEKQKRRQEFFEQQKKQRKSTQQSQQQSVQFSQAPQSSAPQAQQQQKAQNTQQVVQQPSAQSSQANKKQIQQQPQQQKPKKQPLKEQGQQQIGDDEEEEFVYPERHFMQELMKKKAKNCRIAAKVTEVLPVKLQAEKPAEQENQPQSPPQVPQYLQDLQEFDDMNPQEGYIKQLNQFELDPKSYKNIQPQWLKRIPYAGQKYKREEPLKLFD